MAQLLDEAEKSHPNLERGQVVDGVIMKVDRDSILVHIGAKSEGVVPAREMRSLPPESVDELAVGDTLLVAVVKAETDDGQAILSVDRARGEVGWRKLQEYADNGTVIDAEVTGYNRGGAVVTAEGVQGFVPMSQLTTVSRPPADAQDNPELAALVGKTLRLKVIEVSRRRNRAILSERAATQEQRQAQKERLLEELREGEIRKGRVSGITNFGAFVDLGGADGLIHISELSWDSVRSPEEIVTVGDNVDVFVIKVDKEAKRIALSLKRTQTEPWADVAEKYRVGEVTEATITKLASFGAFARIEGSIEGLIHISELADRIIQHPREIVHEGEQVAVRIVKVEADRRRIGLSLKQVKDVEAAEALERYQQGQTEHRVERPALDAGTAAQLEEAMARAAILVKVVTDQGLAKNLGGDRPHVSVEGWTFLASQFGLIPDVDWTKPLSNGWEARVALRRLSDGAAISHAEAECRTAESNWKDADSYAIRSMATTRAVSKVCRIALSSVMVMAGFAATPSEEMSGSGFSASGSPVSKPASPDDPHCPACLAVNGEMVGVSKHDSKPFWRCSNKADKCAGKREYKGKDYSWSGWHNSFENSATEWLNDNGHAGPRTVPL
ncbi:MAG: S1 RNA-binding domain-containing protein, partial [Chloroflexi bacterium]|nr:S1 RNA-binding domain-containing protein [Chloroflexota bacterium]